MIGWSQKCILSVINTSLWNKLIRRDIVERHICFENAPRVAEDMMFLLSIYPFIKKISFCSRVLSHYQVRNDSAISFIKREEIERLKLSMIQTKRYVLTVGGRMGRSNHFICTYSFWCGRGIKVGRKENERNDSSAKKYRTMDVSGIFWMETKFISEMPICN